MEASLNSFDWSTVKMEAILAVFAAITLICSSSLSSKWNRLVSIVAFVGMYASIIVNFVFPNQDTFLLNNNSAFACIMVICALLTSQMSIHFFDKLGREDLKNDYIAVVMICAAALSLFVRSNNLMLSFVALETATICLYIMVAFNRSNSASLEAGIKYLIAGGVSGAVLLMGIVFIYGAGCASGVDFLYFDNFSVGLMDKLFNIGLVLVLAGVFFKMAAFPFQFWAPSVYQGAPTPTTSFLAVASKAAGVVFLAKICTSLRFDSVELLAAKEHILVAVSVVAALTILVGNLGGITQLRTKSLLAFSGISNAGYLLVLIAAVLREPKILDSFDPVLYFYLGAYMLANYALFFGINQFTSTDESAQSLLDYRGLINRNPITSSALIVSLSSLAGIPPTAGFFGKVLVLILAWYAQLYWLMGVMIFGSVVSIYYYFAWIRAILEKSEGDEVEFKPSPAATQTIVMLSVAVVFVSLVVFSFVGV